MNTINCNKIEEMLRQEIIKKLRKLNMLKEGNTKFKIRGDFGQVQLVDLILQLTIGYQFSESSQGIINE